LKSTPQLITPEICVTPFARRTRPLALSAQPSRAEIALLQKTAKYPEFEKSLGKNCQGNRRSLGDHATDIDHPSSGDLWSMLKTRPAIRKLASAHVAPALAPCCSDLASEYFETELLRRDRRPRVFERFSARGPPERAGALIRAAADPHPAVQPASQ